MKRLLIALTLPLCCLAQEAAVTPVPSAVINTARGVPFGAERHTDKKERDPVLSVGTDVLNGVGRILVDSSNLSPEFKDYPVRFEFYVNRKLIETQYYSPQLPGPLGVSVPSSVAARPFNFVVVATVIHPNRSFSSVIEGAIFESNLSRSYSCTLTLGDIGKPDYDGKSYTESVTTTQAGNSAITLEFKSGDKVTANASLTFSGESAAGTLKTEVDGDSDSASVTGEVTQSEGEVTAFSVETESGTKIVCE